MYLLKITYFTKSILDDKIEIAQEMQDHLSKYIAGLDQELHKFKMELEADYSGITEKIEKSAHLIFKRSYRSLTFDKTCEIVFRKFRIGAEQR